jgi:hypothetical protein
MIQLTSTAGLTVKFPDYIFTTNRIRYVDADYVVIDNVQFVRSSLKRLTDESGETAGSGDVATTTVTDLPFDGNRPVKRSGLPLINPAAISVKGFLENYFYPFVPASLAFSGSDANYEYGTQQSITLSAVVTPNDETAIANRRIIETTNGNNIVTVGNANSFGVTLNISGNSASLLANKQRTFRALADVGGNGNPETIQSALRNINFYMPTFYGMSEAILTGAQLFSTLTKVIQNESTKQFAVIYNGTDKYLYFATPFFGSTPIIRDNNGFDVTASFVREILLVETNNKYPRWEANYFVWRTTVPTSVSGKTFTITFP